MAKVYVAGSLQNPRVLETALKLKEDGHETFVDWFSGGPEADVHWRSTAMAQGLTMREAVKGDYAQTILHFDERWMEWADVIVAVGPCGKSAHMEMVRFVERNKFAYLYLPEGDPERWDVMLGWITDIVYEFRELSNLIWEKYS